MSIQTFDDVSANVWNDVVQLISDTINAATKRIFLSPMYFLK